MKVKLTDVAENIFAGGDVPKDRFSDVATEEYKIPIFANAEKDNGLYGYTDVARVSVPCVTVAARGTIGFTAKRIEPFLPVVRLITVIPNKEKITLDYLYYALRNCKPKSSGTSIPQLTVPDIKNYSFEIASISRQKEITRILDEIEQLIEIQKNQIDCYDELIKSRFVEMFGTLDNPAQEFKRATLKELCNKITDGKHGGCTQEEGTKRYFVGAREIYDDEVHYDTAPEINRTEFEKDYKRCNIEIGDFLIVNTGATIGKSAIAIDDRTEHTLLQKSVALLKVKRELLNSTFLKWCYRINTKMYIVESASAQPNLLLSKINATEIYVPNIEFQNQFATFVCQIDKLKVAAQEALDETQKLFNSLMQQYFG